uniref:Very late factor 1 n=1 Tax=Nesodiprion zhejiangensis nucleopolyhedrovirus TaxID=3135970 RepID=A0AAN0LW79_9BACU
MDRLTMYKKKWGVVIRSHRNFDKISQVMIDRQKCIHDSGVGILKKYLFTKPMSNSTKKSYRSKVAKIIYALLPDDMLNNDKSIIDDIINNIYHKTHVFQNDIFVDNIIRSSNICRRSLVLILDFYCNAMDINRNEFKIPISLKTPKDLLNNKQHTNEKNTVVVEIADTIYEFIITKILPDVRDNNFLSHNKSTIRGAVLFLIIVSTALRITEAFHITLDDLLKIKECGQAKINIHLKKKTSDFAYIKLMPNKSKYLDSAIEILQNIPDLFAGISVNSSTKFNDLQNLVKAANVKSPVQIQSNMFRHMLASEMFNSEIPVNTISDYMNHNAPTATRNYINKKYHRGPMQVKDKM